MKKRVPNSELVLPARARAARLAAAQLNVRHPEADAATMIDSTAPSRQIGSPTDRLLSLRWLVGDTPFFARRCRSCHRLSISSARQPAAMLFAQRGSDVPVSLPLMARPAVN
jgi:hypothetical protein